MKLSKSKKMRELLQEGRKITKGLKPPTEGHMVNLFTETSNNGWYYQIEWVHDTREHKKPFVTVFGFKPPARYHARSADIYLDDK